MWRHLSARYRWLDPGHPLTRRDAHWKGGALPDLIRKLSEFKTLIGYAAIMHGIFFAVSMLMYPRVQALLPGVIVPFLTPFGTPIAAAILHSLLYWAMLIGICNQGTYLVAEEFQHKTWRFLRLTPYPTHEILLVKMMTVARIWQPVLRSLILTRIIASILIPLATLVEKETVVSVNLVPMVLFVIQPLVDVVMIGGITLLSAVVIRNITWARIGAYAGAISLYGVFSGIAGLWMLMYSSIGTLAGLLVPLGHLTPLIAALTSIRNPELQTGQTVVLLLTHLIAPLLLGVGCLLFAARLARKFD